MNNARFDELWGQFQQLHRKEELRQLVNLVEWFKPKTILELGVCHGGSFKMWEEVLPSDGMLIGADRLTVVQWKWKESPKNVLYVQGNLDEESTVGQVKKSLAGRQVDFLYIDSNHYYDGVKHHYELFSPLVRDGGIVAFHDIRNAPWGRYGVGKFLSELKEKYKWMEILVPLPEYTDKYPLRGADGIGIIFKEKM